MITRRRFLHLSGGAIAMGCSAAEPAKLVAVDASRSTGPVIFATPAMVETARRRLAAPQSARWDTAWKLTLTRATNGLAVAAQPYQGPSGLQYYNVGIQQAAVARDCALVFALTDDTRFLDKAREVMLAYAMDGEQNRKPGDKGKLTDQAMVISRVMATFCYAFSLVHKALSPAHRSAILAWMANMVPLIRAGHWAWIENDYFGKQLFQNHLGAHVLGLTALGATLHDRALIGYALESDENPRDFVDLIEGAILMRGDPLNKRDPTVTSRAPAVQDGEIYDRYRSVQKKGFGYAMLQLREMALVAEIATNNGILVQGTPAYSVTGKGGRCLEMAFTFYADFLITGDPSIKGGYYSKEKVSRINVQIYELARRQFPANEKIRQVVTQVDPTISDPETFGTTATVTHGVI